MKSNLENIKSIFEQMLKDKWDINNNLKWTFTFFDKRVSKLKKIGNHLEKEYNFDFEEITKTEFDDWKLEVCKRETLNPNELHQINLKLNHLANSIGVELYDGWSAERLTKSEN